MKRNRQIHPKCGKTLTEQHHEKACNINNIMAKYAKTGIIDHVNRHEARYGDVTGADFESAMALVKQAEEEFLGLPAAIRAHFNNDPAAYLNQVQTDEGVAELLNFFDDDEPRTTENTVETPDHEPEPEKQGESE